MAYSKVYRNVNCWMVVLSDTQCFLHDTEEETTSRIMDPHAVASDLGGMEWRPVPARAMLPPTLASAIEGIVC